MSTRTPFVPRKRPARIRGLWRHTARNLATGNLKDGREISAFEEALSGRLGGRAVAAVGSGRFALLLLLRALRIQPPARVILSAYNASCIPNALQAAGYSLYFVDVDLASFHIDPKKLPDAPPSDAQVLLVTHLEGSPAPMKPLLRWAKKHGMAVIEDAAHALGATLDGAPVGTLADGAIFSLGRGKHLNTMGGGLAVMGDDEAGARLKDLSSELPTDSALALARSVVMEGIVATGTKPLIFQTVAAPPLRLARRWGFDPMAALFEDDKGRLEGIPNEWQRRLSNLQAHFGLEALNAFDRALARRREIAHRLLAGLDGVLPIQRPVTGADPAWLELTVRVEDRDGFQRALLARGVDTQRTWMDACDMLEAFRSSPGGPCSVARELGMHALYLPTYASLSDRQCDHIVDSVRDVVAGGGA